MFRFLLNHRKWEGLFFLDNLLLIPTIETMKTRLIFQFWGQFGWFILPKMIIFFNFLVYFWSKSFIDSNEIYIINFGHGLTKIQSFYWQVIFCLIIFCLSKSPLVKWSFIRQIMSEIDNIDLVRISKRFSSKIDQKSKNLRVDENLSWYAKTRYSIIYSFYNLTGILKL